LNKDEDDPLDDVITLEQAIATNKAATAAAASASSDTTGTAPMHIDVAVGATGDTLPISGSPSAADAKKAKSSQKNSEKSKKKKKNKKTAAERKRKRIEEGFEEEDEEYLKAREEEEEFESEVIDITKWNKKSIMHTSATSDVFVQFVVPDCGNCRYLKPDFRRVANAFKDVSIPYIVYDYLISAGFGAWFITSILYV
jgi:thiol-disulfide isomerase/thioredoxin